MSETSSIVTPAYETLNAIPGVVCYRIHAGKVKVRGGWMRQNDAGAPDLLVLVRGIPIAMEAKLPKGLVTEDQLKEHGRIRRAGGAVVIIRSAHEAIQIVRDVQKANDRPGAPTPDRSASTKTSKRIQGTDAR